MHKIFSTLQHADIKALDAGTTSYRKCAFFFIPSVIHIHPVCAVWVVVL